MRVFSSCARSSVWPCWALQRWSLAARRRRRPRIRSCSRMTANPTSRQHGIWLKDANGALVTHLDPGTYEIQVDDHSAGSSFHLTGPGVDIKTEVDFVGQTTWTVTFTDGIYSYHCDVMPDVMHGLFTVGTPPPPPPPPPAKCVVPKVVGKSLAKAKRRLSAAHCRTGAVRHGQSRLRRGIVYWQSRKPGARLPHGTKIGMRVSR